jgi:hypothetical protein
MVGSWDVVGVVAGLVLAVGGVAFGARGVTRRHERVIAAPSATLTQRSGDVLAVLPA